MKEIIDLMDQRIFELLGVGKFYGVCKITSSQSEIFPRTDNTKPEKVAPNDKYPVAIYHRLLDGSIADNEDLSFGRTKKRQNVQQIRTIVILDTKSDVTIEDVYEAIPDEVILCDYKSIWINSEINLNYNQNSIREEEWGTAYADKFEMRFNLYALEYSIEYIKCDADVCC